MRVRTTGIRLTCGPAGPGLESRPGWDFRFLPW